MEFKNINDVTNFVEMTMTEQASIVSNNLKESVKICSKLFYIWDVEKLIWLEKNEDYFITYMFKYFLAKSKVIKTLIGGLKDKRVDKLLDNFDKKAYVKDIVERMNGNLQDDNFYKKLNTKHNYLPIRGGKKINLKDGTITDRTRDDCFTFECAVSKTESKSLKHAEKFFKQLMPNEKHRKFLQKVLGYCITGQTDGRCFFVFYGSGSNGKTKVSEIMKRILGDYYCQCADEVFQKCSDDGKPSPHLACLFGKRFGFYSEGETADQMELNISTIKRISGEDPIKCRKLYHDFMEFKTDVKLCMGTNYVPPLTAEKAIKDRLRYIFFDTCFSDNPKEGEIKKDNEFVENIMTKYLDEVFTWILEGTQEYYDDPKIVMPKDFEKRTNELLNREDSIEKFIKQFVTHSDNSKHYIKRKAIFEKYKSFCDANSQRCQPRSTLFNRLEHLKFPVSTLDGYDVYRNIKCSFDELDEDDTNDSMFGKSNESKRLKLRIQELEEQIKQLSKKETPLTKVLTKEIKEEKPKKKKKQDKYDDVVEEQYDELSKAFDEL
jgi:P4 family phage/plasmid primase-like protien